MTSLLPYLQKLFAKLDGWLQDLIVMLPNLVLALLVLVLTIPIARHVEKLCARLFLGLTQNVSISSLLATMTRIAVVLVGGFFTLELLNLDKTVTSLLAGVGVVGLALGFAFQDIAANFMSGILMALYHPFRPGDFVEIGGHKGRITAVALRDTELETPDGLSITVPNKEVFQSAIVNYTRTSTRRLEFTVGTAYCDDMRRVSEVIISALADLAGRQLDRDVEVMFEEFGDSSIQSRVLVWLAAADPVSYRRARSQAMIAVKLAFDAAKITIPFPIRTLDFGAIAVGGERIGRLEVSASERSSSAPDGAAE